jgi:hypothetical protein
VHRPTLLSEVNVFDIELPIEDRLQFHLNVRPQRIDALDQVHIDHPVVVHAERLADGILCDLEPAVQVAPVRRFEVKVDAFCSGGWTCSICAAHSPLRIAG